MRASIWAAIAVALLLGIGLGAYLFGGAFRHEGRRLIFVSKIAVGAQPGDAVIFEP